MQVCSYFSLKDGMEISKETKRISQKTKRKNESDVSVNLIIKLTSDADYL
jgi:hypothetical protein